MAKKFSDLASRFNKTLESADEAAKKAEAEAKAAAENLAALKAEATAARKELLSDLASMVKQMPALTSRRTKKGALILTLKDRVLTFTPDGDGDRVRVSYEGSPDDEHLFRAQDEDDDIIWVLSRGVLHAPFMMEGFDDLWVVGLGAPEPEDYMPLGQGTEEEEVSAAPEYEEDEEDLTFEAAPLDTEERRDVREVLADRRRESRNRGSHTRVDGHTHDPWNIKVTNPGAKKKKKKDDPNRVLAGQKTAHYDIRPTHTSADNPRRKRKFKVDSGVGSAVKPYKPIIS